MLSEIGAVLDLGHEAQYNAPSHTIRLYIHIYIRQSPHYRTIGEIPGGLAKCRRLKSSLRSQEEQAKFRASLLIPRRAASSIHVRDKTTTKRD